VSDTDEPDQSKEPRVTFRYDVEIVEIGPEQIECL
jgi:hypothetical protein